MAAEKEIRNKINSIINTKKITKAMEMVAIAKMRKAEFHMYSSKPYVEIIKTIIQRIKESSLEYQNIYLDKRKHITRIGLIVVSTDRGLCGNLNNNLFKKIINKINLYTQKNIFCDLLIFGLKGSIFFNSYNNIINKVTNFGEVTNLSKFIYSIKKILKMYKEKNIDKLFIAHNKFINTLKQVPIITQLLPVSHINITTNKKKIWDYIYEPNAKHVLDILLTRYVESQIYQNILENTVSEHAARIIAMKTATDNSSNMIQELQLIYNKTRQASITRELIEIVSGASAVSLDN